VPFENYVARNFSTISVQGYAPASSGVYGLSSAREWIYVGETDDIRATLLRHLAEVNSAVSSRKPTGFTFEICAETARIERQSSLIKELAPVCNTPSARRF
jgi:hypothetical protein